MGAALACCSSPCGGDGLQAASELDAPVGCGAGGGGPAGGGGGSGQGEAFEEVEGFTGGEHGELLQPPLPQLHSLPLSLPTPPSEPQPDPQQQRRQQQPELPSWLLHEDDSPVLWPSLVTPQERNQGAAARVPRQQHQRRRSAVLASMSALERGADTTEMLHALGQGAAHAGSGLRGFSSRLGATRLPPDLFVRWGVEPDVDRMTYEELQELCDRIGYVRTRPRLSKEQLTALPTRIAGERECGGSAGSNSKGVASCAVCCELYVLGEELRTLPCFHVFHSQCIDHWLLSDMPGANKCPVCHHEVPL